ncbi:helix-turn-helix transcriptional regulator [Streptomyces scopuliridis]|uniref:XRE family transcriptional regulator n=1 Tax=Streptomyces scopuliridis RB72 TaxID=1440053 RepID=A0A2T7T9K9_9ACTN|nr:helix-turn-helix transcriptional regulator [Streptomyces scopuliridis]PVE11798.1 XRE family transcriptional regulator [Streptomyces scopuliridis RB72]
MRREQQPVGGSTELGRYLRARRAQVTPKDVGLAAGGGLRRTPGLRREELATLAGISIDYYARLERGKETNPSPSVVDALARALRLETHEHEHLRSLAVHAARTAPEPPIAAGGTLRPGVSLILDSLRPGPAYIASRTNDLLAWNPAGLRLFTGIEDWPVKRRNIARYAFLHPAARELFDDWEHTLLGCIARLRALAGTDPDAPDLTHLVGELLLKSPDFARLWERYDVKAHAYGRKTYHHPDVGTFTLNYQGMQLEGTPGHRLVSYYAEPGTPSHDALVLLDMTTYEPSEDEAEPQRGQSTPPPDEASSSTSRRRTPGQER